MSISFNKLGNMGHLGNQMFQFASLRGIAAKNNLDWSIAPAYSFGKNYPLRSSIYDCFKLDSVDIINSYISNNIQYTEKHYHFDDNLYKNCPDNIDLDGYFQSYKYFNEINDQIIKDFTFKNEISEAGNEIINQLGGKNITSLHVRRTDYLNSPNHHPVPSLDYYEKALSLIKPDKVLVFSDDPEWCKSQDMFKDFSFSVTNNAYLDLYLMSICKNNIMANSSFSWWGSWINKNNDKIVIAPKKWFGPALNHNTEDLIPHDWIVI